MAGHKQVKIEYTSLALAGEDWRGRLQEGLDACHEHGFSFGIQIHNSDSEENLGKLSSLGIQLSFHAPVLSDWQINLAAENPAPAMESISRTASLMRRFSVKKAVFHGFNMTDNPIPAFGRGRGYEESFAATKRPELCIGPGSAICSDFFSSDEYRTRNKRVGERLVNIRSGFPGLKFLVENDFPCYGAGSIFAEHLAWMGNPICLDSSHLWASSFIFDRDFHVEAEKFLKSGLVEMVHLHASKFTPEIPKEKWADGHLPLNTENQMNLPALIKLCHKHSATNFILEINDVSRRDIDFIAKAIE